MVLMHTLLIFDKFGSHKKISLGAGPTLIPCIGDSVKWNNTFPSPKVISVEYNYDGGEVVVRLG